MLGKRLKTLRKEKNLTQEELGRKINVTKVSISGYENNNRSPDTETLQNIADFFDVSVDYLLGRTDDPNPLHKPLPELTTKDEKDIAKDIEDIINNINTDGYANFDGRSIEELDEEDKELLKQSLENSMRLAKRLAKEKFTPKKYKK